MCAPIYPVEPVRRMATCVWVQGALPVPATARRSRERASSATLRFSRGGIGASFDERIAPLSQCRNVHVDPIIPPVDAIACRNSNAARFVLRQHRAQAFYIRRLEHMIVVQNERLEQRDQFDHLFKFALLPRQRRPRRKRLHGAVDHLHDRLLRRRRKACISRSSKQKSRRISAVICARGRSVPGSISGAPGWSARWTAPCRTGSPRTLPGDTRAHCAASTSAAAISSHAAGHRDPQESNPGTCFRRWQLPKKRSQQVRERCGRIDALVPSAERLRNGRFHNRRPHDRNRRVADVRP